MLNQARISNQALARSGLLSVWPALAPGITGAANIVEEMRREIVGAGKMMEPEIEMFSLPLNSGAGASPDIHSNFTPAFTPTFTPLFRVHSTFTPTFTQLPSLGCRQSSLKFHSNVYSRSEYFHSGLNMFTPE